MTPQRSIAIVLSLFGPFIFIVHYMAASDGLFCTIPTQSITGSLLFEGKNDLKTGTEAKSIVHDPIDYEVSTCLIRAWKS